MKVLLLLQLHTHLSSSLLNLDHALVRVHVGVDGIVALNVGRGGIVHDYKLNVLNVIINNNRIDKCAKHLDILTNKHSVIHSLLK